MTTQQADAKLSHDHQRLFWLNRYTFFSENNKTSPSEFAKQNSLLVKWRKSPWSTQQALDDFFTKLAMFAPCTQSSLPAKEPQPLDHPLDYTALDIILNAYVYNIKCDPELAHINYLIRNVEKVAGINKRNSEGFVAYQLFIQGAYALLAGSQLTFPHLHELGINVIILPLTKERTFNLLEQAWVLNPSSCSRTDSIQWITSRAEKFLVLNKADEEEEADEEMDAASDDEATTLSCSERILVVQKSLK